MSGVPSKTNDTNLSGKQTRIPQNTLQCGRESCGDFIWGIGKQGYTCQKCGLAIHKYGQLFLFLIIRRCHGVMSDMPCFSTKPISVVTTSTTTTNNNNTTTTTTSSPITPTKESGAGQTLKSASNSSSSSEEKKTIEPVTKARPPPKRIVSRGETQQILKNMPKTEIEKDIKVEKYTDLTMQRPKEIKVVAEDNKGDLEVVFNSIIQLFKLDEDNKEWKPVDSGKSRLAIYYHTSKLKHRLIALSTNNNFIINSWISNKFVHKRLSERYFCISFDGDHVDFGINFGSKEPSEAFDKILNTIENAKDIKPIDALVMTEIEESGGKRRWTGGASNLPLPQYSKSNSDLVTVSPTPTPSNVTQPESTTTATNANTPNTTSNAPTTKTSEESVTTTSTTATTSSDNTSNKTGVSVTAIEITSNNNNKEEEKLRASSKVGQSPSVGRRRTGTSSSSTSPSSSPINGSPVGSPSRDRKAPPKEVDYEQIIMQMDDKKYQEENFNIKLKFYKNAYFNGETIEGELTLNLASPVSASSVAILFQGIEKAFNGIPGESPGQKSYESSQFFAHKVLLWQASGNNSSLDKKEYKWNFSFKLPEDLPPSIYFEDWLFTFYQARGYVEPANKNIPFPKIVSEAIIFDIYGLTESTWSGTLEEAIPSKDSKSFKSDKIHINAHLKRDHFYVGEIVDIHLKISNSTRDTPPIKVDLFQCVNINANDFKKEFPEVKLFSQKFGDNASRVNKQEIDQVPIPRYNYWTDNTLLILPSLKGKLFTITHYLRVRLDIPFSVDPAVVLPLKLWDGLLDEDTATFQDAFLTMEQ